MEHAIETLCIHPQKNCFACPEKTQKIFMEIKVSYSKGTNEFIPQSKSYHNIYK